MKELYSDPVRWAYEVLEAYFEKRKPVEFESPLLNKRGACFVTLHTEENQLRGCIGTIIPCYENLYQEIRHNALSAAFHDPRFSALHRRELSEIHISVDILSHPEPVMDIHELDPKHYGVIVTSQGSRGVLLPDIEGVDTVMQQLNIACQKGGFHPSVSDLSIERFTVERYH